MTDPPVYPDHPSAPAGDDLRLPKQPGVLRRFLSLHPRLTDWMIAALCFLPSLGSVLVIASVPLAPPTWATALHLAGAVLAAVGILLWRRSQPWLFIGTAWVAAVFSAPFGRPDVLPIVFALYGLGAYRRSRSAWIGFAASVAVAVLAATVEQLTGWSTSPGTKMIAAVAFDFSGPTGAATGTSTSAITNVAVMLIATIIGATVGRRRRHLEALVQRARDLARERDQRARLAVAAERARIARDLHDIVSHSLTVMVTLAEGSAATAERAPQRAAELMRSVADTGRDALGDMRRMLNVLADPEAATADLTPRPGFDDLPTLVAGFRDAGLPVTLTTVGVPGADSAVQLAVYRIVQEGLTNALRYGAHASRVDARIEHGPRIHIVVEDDAPPAVHAPSSRGAGRGLAGLRERVSLYQGELRAGPRTGGGWRLEAFLDTDAGPDDPTAAQPTTPATQDGSAT